MAIPPHFAEVVTVLVTVMLRQNAENMLLKGNKAGTPDEEINQSIEGIEYEIMNAK